MHLSVRDPDLLMPTPTPVHGADQSPWTARPTAEMTRWARRLDRWLRPGSVVGCLLVTPVAHVANRSHEFQAYLYDVFHRSSVSRLGHMICMPAIVAAMFGVAFGVHPAVGMIAGLMLAAWHVRGAREQGFDGLAIAMVGVVTVLAALGAVWSTRPPGSWTAPGLYIGVLGGLQMLSHVAERDVPPRVSGHSAWMRQSAFFAARPVRHAARSVIMAMAGTLNEIWASWRLLHLVILDALFVLGYRADVRAARAARALDACRDGNPAIDFIGRGGAVDRAW